MTKRNKSFELVDVSQLSYGFQIPNHCTPTIDYQRTSNPLNTPSMPSRRLAINIVNSSTNSLDTERDLLYPIHHSKMSQCAPFNSRQRQPQMGDLPQERISPSTPFSHTGLDYCGPITTKTVKIYVAIFMFSNESSSSRTCQLTHQRSMQFYPTTLFCSPRSTNCHLQ